MIDTQWIKSWHEHIMKSRVMSAILLACILVIFGTILIILGLKLLEPKPLEKMLPAEETAFYIEGDIDTVINFMRKIGSEVTFEKKDWMGKRMGIAWVEQKDGSKNEIVFMEQKLKEAVLGENQKQWEDYIVLGGTQETWDLLAEVKSGKHPALKNDSYFIQLRPNLPYDPVAFGYLKPNSVWQKEEIVDGEWFKNFIPLLEFFPATGFIINPHESNFILQTYSVGVSPWTLGPSKPGIEPVRIPLFHSNQNYEGTLLKKRPTHFNHFIGLQNPAAIWAQLRQVLEFSANKEGETLEASVVDFLKPYLGDDLDREGLHAMLDPFLQHEMLLAWSDTNQKVVMIEMDRQAQEKWNAWIDDFVEKGKIHLDVETSTLSLQALQKKSVTLAGEKYTAISTENGAPVFQVLAQNHHMVLTLDEGVMQQFLSERDPQASTPFDAIIDSADGVSSEPVPSSVNLFDDGISTFHLLTLEE